MKEKLGRWIKTIERLPGLNDKVQWRLNGEERDGTETIAEVTFLGAAAFAKYEWKDESPTTADASVLKEALEKIAKKMIVNEGDGTAMFPTLLKEAKERVLIARQALAQYSTQSPSSIEESGLKEGEEEQRILFESVAGFISHRKEEGLSFNEMTSILTSKYHITKKP